MSTRAVRIGVAIFFALYFLALTYPGVELANRIRPLVFGLPFTLFWTALWVALGGVVLLLLHRSEKQEE